MKECKCKTILALLMAVVMIVSFTACGNKVEEQSSEDEGPQGTATTFINPLAVPDGSKLIFDIPNLVPMIEEYYAMNEDTIGWIQVPGTTIDDVVMYYDDSQEERRNYYYLRRNFEKKYSFDGMYFADYRCTFDGTVDGLSRNTVIYGHSMDDDPNGKLLSQLKKYDNRLYDDAENFARENPYIFMSLEDGNYAWEIFAIFDTTVRLPYNHPNATDEAFLELLEEVYARSIYLYDDIDVGVNDKIMTLSTCTYKYDANYPNDYRTVIMAKLVDDDTPLKDSASFTVNPSPAKP